MSDRFRFALKHIDSDRWYLFETLSSRFLCQEYPQLRTTGAKHGDKGRDAEIHSADNSGRVVAQYSVRPDWQKKIRETVRRLETTTPDAAILIYATPFEVGPAADPLKAELQTRFNIHLDIRDQNWFLDREHGTAANEKAAEEFASKVADPILHSERILDTTAPTLDNHEARAAFLYLTLQATDDAPARNLTKQSYDALVKAILRETDNANKMSRSQIHQHAVRLLHAQDRTEVSKYVDLSLKRQKKQTISYWGKEDEFCIRHEQRVRIANSIAQQQQLEAAFQDALADSLKQTATGMELERGLIDFDDLTWRTRRILEGFLFARGEQFAEAVNTGQMPAFAYDELRESVQHDFIESPDTGSLRSRLPDLVTEALGRALDQPEPPVSDYLSRIKHAYTLLAFMRQTPNVQSAVDKLFSRGEIYLDTNAVLPLLVETLIEREAGPLTRLVSAAQEAGVRFLVTPGVIDEVVKHLHQSDHAARLGNSWRGRTPFVLANFLFSGRALREFSRWREQFIGGLNPNDDLRDYLREAHDIAVSDLAEFAEAAEEELRHHTQAFWIETHERRRAGETTSPAAVQELAMHDTECFLGVLMKRRGDNRRALGHETWWLTFDKQASRAADDVADRLGREVGDSPVMNADFLTYYLDVGPARRALASRGEPQLPLMTGLGLADNVPDDLIAAAARVRGEMEGVEERVVRRRVRDLLDQERMRLGRGSLSGMEALEADIQAALSGQA